MTTRADEDGALNDGYVDAKWLHGKLNDLPHAANWDVTDAVKLIQEFSLLVRIIRKIDENHSPAPVGIRARGM